ncbi:hypothetical protein [Staphylococcus intermedius]|uniref:hypothetical protein n=1 Tax=Staphylococcus intermedius TaxID=1285 RepID=UPI000BBBC164|nr:hypothetical protein [Staphylococcus intermedius]PCF86394.1 hypothetical protein B4W75_10590 [Staphylococcus intermedius]
MNILNLVRSVIREDNLLRAELGDRIYFYELTENADVSKPFVVLTPILDEPSDFASDKYLSEEYLIQVDVESTNHQKTIDITKRIRLLLFINNMMQASSQLDEYFKETKRYVMSRRYRGIPKNQYYKGKRIE